MAGVLGFELGIPVALLLGLALALEGGYRFGRRSAKRHDAPSGGQVGAIQGAVLGLLGLLLGFSFAGAATRFLERQELIVQEANTVGTAYLRADLLDQPHASRVREILANYVQHRLDASKSLATGYRPEDAAMVAEFHARLWEAARDGALAKPAAMLAVLNPVNDVIDTHSLRIAAGRKHLPSLILGLLIVCSVLALGVIGYGCGLSGRRSLPMTAPLGIVVAAALWTTIDLDHPRAGLLRLSDAPLEQLDLRRSP